MTGLFARLATRLGTFQLDATLEAAPSGVSGIFGPSGSGKTSLLRCLAGLTRAETGLVRFGGDVWQDESCAVFVPPHRRGVGYVAQHSDLFPHLTVRQNLRFAARRVPQGVVRMGWAEVVEWVAIGALLDRSVVSLSGGERQRVALGRALLACPRLLLLDEPVSALDEPSRRDVLESLGRVFRELDLPVLYVSHSLGEVGRLANHLVWLVDGRVADAGPVSQVLGRSDFARWRGEEITTVLDGRLLEHDDVFQLTRVGTALGDLWIHRRAEPIRAPIRVQVNARDVSIGLVPQEASSILNELPVQVLEVADLSPSDCLVRLTRAGSKTPVLLARVTMKSRTQLALQPGLDVFARVKSVAVLD